MIGINLFRRSFNHNPKTNRSPSFNSINCCGFNLAILSVRKALSRVMIWLMLMTESLLNLDNFFGNKILPGASASLRLEVMTAASRVLMRLSLKWSEETTTTGRRQLGSEPLGSGKDAHQISPRFITILPCLRIALARHNLPL